MKRYLLGAVLIGNCAVGMEASWKELAEGTVARMSKERLLSWKEELITNGTSDAIDAFTLQAIDARLAYLTKIEREAAQVEIAQLEQAMPVGVDPLDSTYAHIARCSREELVKEYSDLRSDTELGRSLGAAVAARYEELSKQELAQRTAVAGKRISDELSDTFDQIPSMTKDQLLDYQEKLTAKGSISPFIRSQINERLEVLKIEGDVTQGLEDLDKIEGKSEAAVPKKVHFEKDSSSTIARPTQLRPADVPAPFSTDDFEDAVLPDEDFQGSQNAIPASDARIGIDAVPVPISPRKDPLVRVKTPPSVSPEEPKEAISPAATPAPEFGSQSGEARASRAFVASKGQELRRDELPVEPIVGSNGKAYTPASRESSGEITWDEAKNRLKKEESGQTPGGPDDSSDSDLDSSSSDQNNQWSTAQKTLIAAGVVAAVYGSAELVLAYKTIPAHEWHKTSGVLNKAKLVLGKTWENIKKRPSQVGHVLKKSTNSVFEKFKRKADLDVKR